MFLLLPAAFAFDADTLVFSGALLDAQGGLQVEAPTVGDAGATYLGVGGDWARNPLVQVVGGQETNVIGDRVGVDLLAGYTIRGYARLDAALPSYVLLEESGENVGFVLGDLRLGAVVPVVRSETWGVALGADVTLPTAGDDPFVGTSGVGTDLLGIAGFRTPHFFTNLNLGISAKSASRLGAVDLGSGALGGLGLGVRPAPVLLLGVELDGRLNLDGERTDYSDPLEAHVYTTLGRTAGFSATLGAGTGLVAGVGAPELRVIAALGYRAPGAERLRDGDADGLHDDVDACPNNPEDRDGFQDLDGCPDVDNDIDTVPDVLDGCRNIPEDIDGFQDADGCPESDNDRDGIVDAQDACPSLAGPLDTRGCPDSDGDGLSDSEDTCPAEAGPRTTGGCPDRDRDEVPDSRDACPDEPKDPREDPARSNGCPQKVIVSKDRIEFKDPIFFDTGLTSIKPESYAILAEIGKVLRANPDFTRVEVAGHTDNVGPDDRNLKLSQGRAEAVVRFLEDMEKIEHGRLVPVGYGETVPMDTNATTEGRANNRRVEFVIKVQ